MVLEGNIHLAVAEPILFCEFETAEILSSVLQGLLLNKNDQTGLIIASPNGLKIVAEKSKSLQAKAYIKSELLDTFQLRSELLPSQTNHSDYSFAATLPDSSAADSLEFAVNLSVLYECVTLFGEMESSHYKLSLTYYDIGDPLTLRLEDEANGIWTDCEIRTIETSPLAEFNFRSEPIACRAMVKSVHLKEFISDLDYIKDEADVMVSMSPDAPHFSIGAKGDVFNWAIEIPKDSGIEIISSFECESPQQFLYHADFFKRCFKSISRSGQVNFRINSLGILSMQFVLKCVAKSSERAWIEFLICPTTVPED